MLPPLLRDVFGRSVSSGLNAASLWVLGKPLSGRRAKACAARSTSYAAPQSAPFARQHETAHMHLTAHVKEAPRRPRQAKLAGRWACLLGLTLSGCASTIDHGEGYQTRRYFGWLEVLEHRHQQQISIERVQATGLRIGPGFGIGHFDDRRIELPLDCHLIVVVKSIEQWQQLLTAYPQLQQQEMKPCLKPLDH